MVNYGNSMIYKLCCKDTNITDIYIGSTTNFYRRKSQHKSSCNNINHKSYNCYKYQFIRDNGGFENWDMVLVENISCSSKIELLKIERDYIDNLKPILNSVKSYTSIEEKKEYSKEYSKEYYHDNTEHKKEYSKEYNKKNKDQIKQKKKEYDNQNKEYKKEYNKEYREKNKEKLNQKQKEYNKEYREKNKEKLNQKINCPICNSLILKRNIKQHQQSKKCISCK